MPLPPTPISAMTPATGFSETDVFPALESGANVKCTRVTFLSALPGEQISMSSAGTNLVMDPAGNVLFDLVAGSTMTVNCAGSGSTFLFQSNGAFLGTIAGGTQWEVDHATGAIWILDVNGAFQIASAAGQFVYLLGGGSQIFLGDGTGIQFFVDAGQSVNVPYLVGFPAAWGGPGVPADWETALDRISKAVAALGGPIP